MEQKYQSKNNDFSNKLTRDLEALRANTKFQILLKKHLPKILKITAKIVLFSPARNGSIYRHEIGNQNGISPQEAKKTLKKIKGLLEISQDKFTFKASEQLNIEDWNNVYGSFSKNEAHFIFRNVSCTNGQLDSFFCFIRNSFAHGNFFVNNKGFLLWNFNKDNYKGFGTISFVLLNEYLNKFCFNDNLN